MKNKKIAALISAAAIMCTVFSGIKPDVKTAAINTKDVYFNNFDASVNGGEVIKGVDISSIISVENAGIEFYNDFGNKQDIFKTLSEKGVNYIRVRVWNNPATQDGHSYGGGKCDVNNAAEIGRRAAEYNIKLLVDFQYSDFWADPGKQTPPKAWKSYSHEQKKQAIYDYTKQSLKTIADAGADIGMVQVGNETNCFFCGEKDMYKICDLFSAGIKAVREFDRNVMAALHFANPATGYFDWYAQILNECRTDYDVFAISYYPYWHGTPENMTSVLKAIADKYNKYVMVAETAYPHTNEDGDTFRNDVTSYMSGVDLTYDVSVEGQAQSLTDVFQAVANVGSKGIGVFYWEPAWIGKNGQTYEQNKKLWDSYGNGWATEYAIEFDESAKEAGGSSYDNQALFGFDGKPLDSLNVFTKIYPQKSSQTVKGEAVEEKIYRIKNVNSGKYLTVANGSKESGANVVQYEADGQADYNSWKITAAEDGYYFIYSEVGEKNLALDLERGKDVNKTNIEIYTSSGGNAQKFKFIKNDDGTYYIVTKNSQDKKAVEIDSASEQNGGNAQQYEINGNNCQKWILEPVEQSAMLGDINDDNEIDIFDLTALRNEIINGKNSEKCDLNGDNSVDIADCVILKKAVLGEENFTPKQLGTPINTIQPLTF